MAFAAMWTLGPPPATGTAAPHCTDATGCSGSPSGIDIQDTINENALDDLKTWLITQPGVWDAGFVSSSDDLSTRTMTLLWHGISESWTQSIEQQATALGDSVAFVAAANDQSTLDTAAESLLHDTSTPSLLGFQAYAVEGATPSFDGLTIDGQLPVGSLVSGSEVASAATELLAADNMHVDVRVALSAPGIDYSLYYARDHDSTPFFAGGLIGNAGNADVCSSGFAVLINGVPHTTTARHCNDGPWYAHDDHSGSIHEYGTFFREAGVAAGRVLTGRGDYDTFKGPWYLNSPETETVESLVDLSVGDTVCGQGGNSGAQCGLKVTNTSYTFNDGTGNGDTTGIKVVNPQGNVAGAPGDSGGPVITWDNDGVHVRAAGMIQYGAGNIFDSECSTRVPTPCGTWEVFTSTRSFINHVSGESDVKLFTGP